MTRATTFLGLMLLCPCPWYMLSVGGLLPLPVIVAYGTAGGLMLVFSLIHLVVYTWIFHKIAWSIGSFVRHRHISQTFGAAVVAATLVAVGFAPIYGRGKNFPVGNKLNHTAWEMYRSTFPALRRWPTLAGPGGAARLNTRRSANLLLLEPVLPFGLHGAQPGLEVGRAPTAEHPPDRGEFSGTAREGAHGRVARLS